MSTPRPAFCERAYILKTVKLKGGAKGEQAETKGVNCSAETFGNVSITYFFVIHRFCIGITLPDTELRKAAAYFTVGWCEEVRVMVSGHMVGTAGVDRIVQAEIVFELRHVGWELLSFDTHKEFFGSAADLKRRPIAAFRKHAANLSFTVNYLLEHLREDAAVAEFEMNTVHHLIGYEPVFVALHRKSYACACGDSVHAVHIAELVRKSDIAKVVHTAVRAKCTYCLIFWAAIFGNDALFGDGDGTLAMDCTTETSVRLNQYRLCHSGAGDIFAGREIALVPVAGYHKAGVIHPVARPAVPFVPRPTMPGLAATRSLAFQSEPGNRLCCKV